MTIYDPIASALGIEPMPRDELYELKQEYKDFRVEQHTPRNYSHLPEIRQAISVSLKGHIVTEETRAKMSLSHTDLPHSEETKAKIGAAHKGKVLSKEQCLAHSLRHKGKLAGEKNPMHGKSHSEEAKAKVSQANKGRVRTEESRRRQSEAWARKKLLKSLEGR